MKMKKGAAAIMLFHCAGFISEESWHVSTVHKDRTVTLENDKRFSLETGECLNDDTTFGAKRTLKLT